MPKRSSRPRGIISAGSEDPDWMTCFGSYEQVVGLSRCVLDRCEFDVDNIANMVVFFAEG